MKWLVQEFLNSGSNIRRVSSALDSSHTQYLLIRLNKDNTLTVIDKENLLPLEQSDDIISNFIAGEKIMVYGSKAFSEKAVAMDLSPGSFMNGKFVFDVLREKLGEELLNFHFTTGELWDLKPTEDRFFIRPTGNTKLFTGTVVTAAEFCTWQENETRGSSPYDGEILIMSKVQEIHEEYRFFVVNNKIVTYSHYQTNGNFDKEKIPSVELVAYANKIIHHFPLANAYVLDIAVLEEGFKVIEYNNINSSGLYGCNENLFVQAINEL